MSDELNKEFEKLKEISEALQLVDGFDGNKYHSLNNHRTADWLNGALYAYQEQQKKLDAVYDVKQKMVERIIELSADNEKLENRLRKLQ